MPDLSIFSSNLPATIAAFAAGITGLFASLKFYLDKAAKVSDFRKAWIETLRQAVAEFSGHTHTIAGRIAIRKRHDERAAQASEQKESEGWLGFFKDAKSVKSQFDKELETELLDHWSGLRLSYNKIVLHLNPSEHPAYIDAEEAIAAYTKGKPEDAEVRRKVADFLYWCIHLAEDVNRGIMEKKLRRFPWQKISVLGAKKSYQDLEQDTDFEDARTAIVEKCTDAGSCVLLSAFATRQLLHGKYELVYDNVPRIEHGIRVVDTSAAIVIKTVWETIKRGEPAYRGISLTGIVVSFFLLAFLLIALFSEKPAAKSSKLTASCIMSTSAVAGTSVAPTTQAANRLSCEADILP